MAGDWWGWLDPVRDRLPENPLMRQAVIGAAVLVLTIACGAVIGTVAAGGSGKSSSDGPVAGLRPASTGELIEAPRETPKVLKTPLGMGSRKAGVAVLALSQVDSVRTKSGTRRAPEGSRMIAFRIGDWACESKTCESWETLEPTISIDATQKPLTPGTDTYVVVVPPGTDDVTLAIDADGFPQSLSLLDQSASEENIALLSKADLNKPVPIQQTFPMAERTSIELTGVDGQPTDTFYRTMKVGTAQRHFFLNDATPGRPGDVFLVITVAYSYQGQQGLSALDLGQAAFTSHGKTYAARDLDPSPDTVLLGFEIPASVTTGNFVIGGTITKTSTTGVAYDSTLETRKIKLDLL